MTSLHCARLPLAAPARSVRGCAAARALLLLTLLGGGGAQAGESADAADARSDTQLIEAIQDAAQHRAFSGTIIYHRGDEVHASRVVQAFDGSQMRERVLTLDGQQREFIRRGDEVQCLYPKLHRIVVEHSGPLAFPAIAAQHPADIFQSYELHRTGKERVAGTPCNLIDLTPRDHLRYGYRLCMDPTTGLLLKAQTVNGRTVLEEVSFTDVKVGEPIDPSQLKPSWRTDGWKIDRPATQPAQMHDPGWSVSAPSGFRRLTELVRSLMGAGDNAPRSALQSVYSDGLATVSVFIEPGAPTLEDMEMFQRRGPVTAVSRSVEGARVTVVGDVPPATAQSFAVVRSTPNR